MKFKRLLYPILHIVLPSLCHSCQAPFTSSPVPFFCETCWLDIQPLKGPFCPQCGKSFSSPWALSFSPTHRCGDCRANPPFFDRMIAPFSFEGVLADAIFLFKYQKKTDLALPLFKLAFAHLKSLERLDWIIPVPLHPIRLRNREFNQSLLLADGIGRFLKKPVLIDLLVKTKPTDSQMTLSHSDRRKNLKNSFSLRNSLRAEDKTVLLVDDVLTTGTTMNECARRLKKGGCKEVIGFALARALLRFPKNGV